MHAPGVEVRPLVQATGEAEFNEVYFTDVRIPDAERLGDVGEGWRVSLTTLMNERVSIGGQVTRAARVSSRVAVDQWKQNADAPRTPWHATSSSASGSTPRSTGSRTSGPRRPARWARPGPRARSASSRWPGSTSGS